MAEYAPGIPTEKTVHTFPKVEKPRTFEFGLHEHHAERAGKHFDLRLGDPATGYAHSWAMRYWPKPGEVRLAVQQPTHTLEYMDFEGTIKDGYGKGKVDLARRDKTEIVSSSKGHVRFNLYSGKGVEEYLLRHTSRDGDDWMLHNVTTTRGDLPSSKPSYKVLPAGKLDPNDTRTVMQAKIDGAHVLYNFKKPGSTMDVLSYRPTDRATGIIEHTQKLPDYQAHKTPAAMKDTILRGELYAVDKNGKALPAARVGGILNAGVWKSREKQETEGQLVPVVFDVVKWKGKNVEKAPYAEKLELLRQATKHAPWLNLPRTAETPEDKEKLISDIRSGKEPSTEEGVIEWNLDKNLPRKSKFLREADAYVKDIFLEQGTRKGLAGGFAFSKTPGGPVVGRVGTGFSHALKRDMAAHPEKYKGLHARLAVQPAPAHYAPRAPAFKGWHLDEELPEGVKMASYIKAFVREVAKIAASAPTRGNFMQASDIPSFRAPQLGAAIQKTGDLEAPDANAGPVPGALKKNNEEPEKEKNSDALPSFATYSPGDFRPANLNAKHAGHFKLEGDAIIETNKNGKSLGKGNVLKEKDAGGDMSMAFDPAPGTKRAMLAMTTQELSQYVMGMRKQAVAGLTPASQLEKSTSIGAPKVSAPPGPSIADQVKPRGKAFGIGMPGAFKGTIG